MLGSSGCTIVQLATAPPTRRTLVIYGDSGADESATAIRGSQQISTGRPLA
jgi:hypothetical protein